MVETVIAGRYRLERAVGSGGMSEVWAATDLELERPVAVKLLAADADPARFDREARAAAGLAHPNICALYDYGRADGRRFMVLELLPGGSLEDRLGSGQPLPDEETGRIAGEVAAGLAHAHERGVVHRDLKPANILFDAEGRAKVADFGIARTGDATGLTEAGTVLGTAAYISPEQAAGRPATPASDVYAFGVILFRLLTGRLPFESPDALSLAAMHRDLPAPSVSELRRDAPPRLESIAGAALAKSPADRPPDGSALVAELAGAVPPASAADATAATAVLAPPPKRRSPFLLGAAIAVVAAGGVALAMAVTLGPGAKPAPPSTTHTTTRPPAAPPSSAPTTTFSAEPPTTEETVSSTQAATTATVTSPETTTAPLTTSTPTSAPATTLPATTVPPPPPVTTEPATTAPPTTAPSTTGTATTTPTDTAATTATATTPSTVPG